MKARKIVYSGRVQGVGFRYSVRQLVEGFDVSGYVKNIPDGTVELWVQGEDAEMDALAEAIQESHLLGFIQETDIEDVSADPQMKGFQIR